MENINNSMINLAPTTTLAESKYAIDCVIGTQDLGITYKAKVLETNESVYLMEFFLENKCARQAPDKVVVLQDITREEYEKERQQFVEDAKALQKLKHGNIIDLLDVFDENNTSYIVVPFVEGQSWQEFESKDDFELQTKCMQEVKSVKDFLKSQGLSPLQVMDIKPYNFSITSNNQALLTNFGSVRISVSKEEEEVKEQIIAKTELPQKPEQEKGIETEKKETEATLNLPVTTKASEIANKPGSVQQPVKIYAALACSRCNRPLPICNCPTNNNHKK